ncbi:MAG: endo alpha-1,4 polygalactosaminidase, partial [Ilumatobacteraceae bacterium]
MTPGTSWQWQLGGNAIDETVLDKVANPKKMFDVDLFTTSSSTIDHLHAKGITVICYMETGAWESYRPDAAQYPDGVLGQGVDGYPDERFVDIRQISVLL